MYEELADTAVLAAREGARVLLGYFRAGGLDARSKGDHDFVTRADHESEARVIETLRRHFPDHHVLAEEGGYDERDSEYCWFVDPLDGTSNFMQGLPVFSISIACRRRDEMVAGVVEGLTLRREGDHATASGRCRAVQVSRSDTGLRNS